MAITLADFSKIWASTSPLTPYTFSDPNYAEGWNFIGGTPPARQMWDFLQKNNDEKMKYIVDNYLPLSGGTITGDVDINGTLKNNNENVLTSSYIAHITVTLSGSVSANNWADFSGTITYPTGYSHALCLRSVLVPSPANMNLLGWEISDTTVKVRIYSKTSYSGDVVTNLSVTK